MSRFVFVFAGFILFSSGAYAGETLNADAVRKLLTGNTVQGVTPNGKKPKIFFSADGKAIRKGEDGEFEGTWKVQDDGMQCVVGLPGGCALIVRNDDGTYDRVTTEGKVLLKWTAVVNGKDF